MKTASNSIVLFAAVVIMVVLAGVVANAQGMCTAYVGKTVSLTTVEVAISGLANLTPKGEFETTAQFKARRATALNRGINPIIIGKNPEEN